MNYSFYTGTFVRAWKIAEVTPILKSGNSEDPSNNRPISPLAILSKVSERLANGKFVDYFTANKILAKTENCFIQLRLPFYVQQTNCCRQLMIKRSQLWCYSTCQRPLTALDMIFYCRNYKLLVSPFHAVTRSIATLLAAVKEYASMMLSLSCYP